MKAFTAKEWTNHTVANTRVVKRKCQCMPSFTNANRVFIDVAFININQNSVRNSLPALLEAMCTQKNKSQCIFDTFSIVILVLPTVEGADILADKAISDPKVGKEWCQRTNRAVFTWRKPCHEAGKVTYQDRHLTFNNSVRDAIRRGAANEVQKHEKKLTGVWRQMSTLRRRYEKWCKGDDIEGCTHKQLYEESYQSMVKVLQQTTWIDDRQFLKSCVRARAEQGNINHPAYGTWTADFMLRQMRAERS